MNSDCASGESCCGLWQGTATCATSCLGESCERGQHCALGLFCCGSNDKKCLKNCTGQSCNSDNNCSTGQCCDHDRKCKIGDCNTESGVSGRVWHLVVGIVTPLIIVVFLLVFCYCRKIKATASRCPAHEGETQSATTATTLLANQQQQQLQMYSQSPPPYPNQPPHPNQPPPSPSQPLL